MKRILCLLLILIFIVTLLGGCVNKSIEDHNETSQASISEEISPESDQCYIAASAYGFENLMIDSINHYMTFDWTVDARNYKFLVSYSNDNTIQSIECTDIESQNVTKEDVSITKNNNGQPCHVTLKNSDPKDDYYINADVEYVDEKISCIIITQPYRATYQVPIKYLNNETVEMTMPSYYAFISLEYLGLCYYDTNLEDGYPTVVFHAEDSSVKIDECNINCNLQLCHKEEAKMFEQWTTIYMLMEAFD